METMTAEYRVEDGALDKWLYAWLVKGWTPDGRDAVPVLTADGTLLRYTFVRA